MEYTKELQIATQTVQRASKITKSVLAAVDKGALDKKDKTPVTIADFAVQALIIAAIHAAFPDDGFVGEESAAALREDQELLERVWGLVSSCFTSSAKQQSQVGGGDDDDDNNDENKIELATPSTQEEMLDLIDLGGKGPGGPKGRIWVLDPVDGTETFIRGQQYAVCLALLEDGQQKLAVLGCPNLRLETTPGLDSSATPTGRVHEDIVDKEGDGQMVFAIAGQGAFIQPMNYSSSSSSASSSKPAVRLPFKGQGQVLKPSDARFVDCKASKSTVYEKHALVASKLGATWPATVDLWSAQMRYVAVAVGEEKEGANTIIKILRNTAYRSCLWDHAGGMLIAQEVGCVITDVHGRPVSCAEGRTLADSVGLVVAPAAIHEEVLRAVQEVVDGNI